MFEGEKSFVFWIGLIILGLASVVLFGISWMIVMWNGYGVLKQVVPGMVGGLVFLLIGLYMMMCGVKNGSDGPEMKRKTVWIHFHPPLSTVQICPFGEDFKSEEEHVWGRFAFEDVCRWSVVGILGTVSARTGTLRFTSFLKGRNERFVGVVGLR